MAIARNWCFTIIGEEAEQWRYLENEYVRYIVHQKEKCPSTGKIHTQGYVELNKPCRMKKVKDILNDHTAHLEVRKGTREQARAYCMKSDTQISPPEEFGDWGRGGQGRRNDIKDTLTTVLENGWAQAIEDHTETVVRYHKGLQFAQGWITKEESKEFRKVEVTVLVGPAGCGKTRRAYEEFGDIYKLDQSNNGTLWFDGYEGEETLLIDDFYGWIKYSHLLNLLDGYQMRLQTKGSHTYARWTKVVITSNQEPQFWYQNMGLTDALERRLNNIVTM